MERVWDLFPKFTSHNLDLTDFDKLERFQSERCVSGCKTDLIFQLKDLFVGILSVMLSDTQYRITTSACER